MKIYIIRHGETNSNVEGRLQGWSDAPLNDMGVLLARETGKALKGIRFDVAFSSPLSRARATAEILLEETGCDVPVELDDRLKEICMGEWEGLKLYGSGNAQLEETMKAFFVNPLDMPPFPGGESLKQVMERTQAFLKELATKEKQYDCVLVATHGCAFRSMMHFLHEDQEDFWHRHVPYNCCINVVEVKDGNISLVQDDMVLYDASLCVDRYKR